MGMKRGSLAGMRRESPLLLQWAPHSSLTWTAEACSESEGRLLKLVLFRASHSPTSIYQVPSYHSSSRLTYINLFGLQDSPVYY